MFVSGWDVGAVRTGHCGASSAADWDVLRWSELFEGAGQSEEGARLRSVWQHWGSQGEGNSNANATRKNIKIYDAHFQFFSFEFTLHNKPSLTVYCKIPTSLHLTSYYTFESFFWIFCSLSDGCQGLGCACVCSPDFYHSLGCTVCCHGNCQCLNIVPSKGLIELDYAADLALKFIVMCHYDWQEQGIE